MLKHLYIKNFVLIDELEVDFSKGLTVITGETGAGKTILTGALALLLGQRADAKKIIDKSKKSVVEGIFEIDNYKLQPFFAQHDIEYEQECSMRRVLTPSGKSRAFINDTPVPISVFKALGIKITDIHSQNETLSLNSVPFQFKVLDAYAEALPAYRQYLNAYSLWKNKRKALEKFISETKDSDHDIDYIRYQLDELNKLMPKPGEVKELEEEDRQFKHLEKIQSGLRNALDVMVHEEYGISSRLKEATAYLKKIASFSEAVHKMTARLESTGLELDDIITELEHLQTTMIYDQGREEYIKSRLDALYKLEFKHQVKSSEELMDVKNKLESRAEQIEQTELKQAKLEEEIRQAEQAVHQTGKTLSEKRRAGLQSFADSIIAVLKELNISGAQFKIELTGKKEAGMFGLDDIRFLFSANKGIAMQPLKNVASGGELSRLILAIRSVVAGKISLPTIVFDEIDSGVSGETAGKVGKLIKKMAGSMQVIAITHLPQIASKSDFHLHISKDSSGSLPKTSIKKLNQNERLQAIAKMLSGEQLTPAALENAKALISYD